MVFRKFPASTVVMIGRGHDITYIIHEVTVEIFSRMETFVYVGLMILTAHQCSSFSAFLVISSTAVAISSRFLLILILVAI
ncbi:hypothetical protein PS15m_010334 [Mucor circinelloides]